MKEKSAQFVQQEEKAWERVKITLKLKVIFDSIAFV